MTNPPKRVFTIEQGVRRLYIAMALALWLAIRPALDSVLGGNDMYSGLLFCGFRDLWRDQLDGGICINIS